MTGGDRLKLCAGALALAVAFAAAPAAAQANACLKSAEAIARATESEDISDNAASVPRILDHNATDLFEVDCGPKGAMTAVRMRPLVQEELRRDYLDLAATVVVRLAPRGVTRSAAAKLVERCMKAADRVETFEIKGRLRAHCAGTPRVLTLTLR